MSCRSAAPKGGRLHCKAAGFIAMNAGHESQGPRKLRALASSLWATACKLVGEAPDLDGAAASAQPPRPTAPALRALTQNGRLGGRRSGDPPRRFSYGEVAGFRESLLGQVTERDQRSADPRQVEIAPGLSARS